MNVRNTSRALLGYVVCSIALILVAACNSVQPQQHNQQPPIIDARQTLNWPGTYQGMLPCISDCSGIATMIILYPNNHFTLRTRKIDVDIKDQIEKGTFTWSPNHNDIKLTGEKALSIPMSHIKIEREAISIVPAVLQEGESNKTYELRKTGGLPTPPPTI